MDTLYTEVLVTVATMVFSAVGAFLVNWLRSHIRTTDFVLATDVARAAVKAVEQMAGAHNWDALGKYAKALKYAEHLADAAGIHLTPEQWQTLIEKAVHELRNDFASLLSEPAPPPAQVEVKVP